MHFYNNYVTIYGFLNEQVSLFRSILEVASNWSSGGFRGWFKVCLLVGYIYIDGVLNAKAFEY